MRRISIAVLVVLVASSSFAAALRAGPDAVAPIVGERQFRTMGELEDEFADKYPLEPTPEGLDVVQAADYWLNERAVNGRASMDWVRWAESTFALRAEPVSPAPAERDLTAEVMRLYRALDLAATPADELLVAAAARDVPAELRAPFADLVAAVADAYAAQAALAEPVPARIVAFDGTGLVLSEAERDAMAANGAAILDAFNAFRARTAPAFDEMPRGGGADAPLFADPEGLVVLGGMGDGTYERGGLVLDPVLVVEPAGNDLYLTSAGGACPDPVHLLHQCNGLSVSVVFDLGGNDTYEYDGPEAAVQGAGSVGGLGMLVDVAGTDRYFANLVRGLPGPFFQYLDGGAQGFAQAGFGLLLDGEGDDAYEINVYSSAGRSIWGFGQGFGSLGSVGLAIDLAGDDRWVGLGNGGVTGGSFQGLYNGGSGFWGGVGILVEKGAGDDVYHDYLEARTTDYYAWAFGAFGGLGVLFDDGGNDDYYGVEKAHNPFINPLLNCAFGTASYGGVGVFVDVAGNDRYYGDTITPRVASTMNEGFGGPGAAYGLFVDLAGDDEHLMYATGGDGGMLAGRGIILDEQLRPAHNVAGNYLDAGGVDVYVGGGEDHAVWYGGADLNLMPGELVV